MPKEGFTRDAGVIAGILHNDPGGIAAVDAAAQNIFNQMSAEEQKDAFISEPYHTDRYVRAVMVAKDRQAKHGAGTRAAQKAAVSGSKKRAETRG